MKVQSMLPPPILSLSHCLVNIVLKTKCTALAPSTYSNGSCSCEKCVGKTYGIQSTVSVVLDFFILALLYDQEFDQGWLYLTSNLGKYCNSSRSANAWAWSLRVPNKDSSNCFVNNMKKKA